MESIGSVGGKPKTPSRMQASIWSKNKRSLDPYVDGASNSKKADGRYRTLEGSERKNNSVMRSPDRGMIDLSKRDRLSNSVMSIKGNASHR